MKSKIETSLRKSLIIRLVVPMLFLAGCENKKEVHVPVQTVVTNNKGSTIIWIDEEKVMSVFPEYVKLRKDRAVVEKQLQDITVKVGELVEKGGKTLEKAQQDIEKTSDAAKALIKQKDFEKERNKLNDKLTPLRNEATNLHTKLLDIDRELNLLIESKSAASEAALLKVIKNEPAQVVAVIGKPVPRFLYIADEQNRTQQVIDALK